jgi:hypothetical protein
MTRSQIIQLVQDQTEHHMDANLDWDAMFNQVLQEFCAEFRFWWRKKRLTFSTVSGTAVYDLTTITTVPANAGLFVEEITKVARVESSSSMCTLEPVTDDLSIAGYENDTTTDKPSVWMPDESSLTNPQSIRLGKVPNGIYTIYVYFWAMPNPVQDADDDVIYVVPPFLHHVVQTALEKEVWRLYKGVQDPKYATALTLYNKKVAAAKIKRSLDGEHVAKFQNNNCEAVRSTD